MGDCHSCSRPIPYEQTVCSECYGDIDYGSDGYYRQACEEQERQHRAREEGERQQMEEEWERLNTPAPADEDDE